MNRFAAQSIGAPMSGMRSQLLVVPLFVITVLSGCSAPMGRSDSQTGSADLPEQGVTATDNSLGESEIPEGGLPASSEMSGHAKFVVDHFARTLTTFEATLGSESCQNQGADGERFFNSFAGVGSNSPADYGQLGNMAHSEFLKIFERGLRELSRYCTALRDYEDSIPVDLAYEDYVLVIEASYDIYSDFPVLLEAPIAIRDEFCRSLEWSPEARPLVYESLVENHERLLTRQLTRDADFARLYREQNIDIAQSARNAISDRWGTLSEYAEFFCG